MLDYVLTALYVAGSIASILSLGVALIRRAALQEKLIQLLKWRRHRDDSELYALLRGAGSLMGDARPETTPGIRSRDRSIHMRHIEDVGANVSG